jgi:hypothetical protein
MKKFNLVLLAIALSALSGCAVIGGIFKAGVAVGVIAVIIVVVLVIWIIAKIAGK